MCISVRKPATPEKSPKQKCRERKSNVSFAKFIVIEGLEGAGKSSAINLIRDFIENIRVKRRSAPREPGGTPLAERIRDLVKIADATDPLCDEAECLLIYAARAQLVANVKTRACAGSMGIGRQTQFIVTGLSRWVAGA